MGRIRHCLRSGGVRVKGPVLAVCPPAHINSELALLCHQLTAVSDALTGGFRQAKLVMDTVCRYDIAQTPRVCRKFAKQHVADPGVPTAPSAGRGTPGVYRSR